METRKLYSTPNARSVAQRSPKRKRLTSARGPDAHLPMHYIFIQVCTFTSLCAIMYVWGVGVCVCEGCMLVNRRWTAWKVAEKCCGPVRSGIADMVSFLVFIFFGLEWRMDLGFFLNCEKMGSTHFRSIRNVERNRYRFRLIEIWIGCF